MSPLRSLLVCGFFVLLLTPSAVEAQLFHPETGDEIIASEIGDVPSIDNQLSTAPVPVQQRGETLTLIKHLAEGEGEDVSVPSSISISNNILYRGNGGYFEVLEVSDPNSPKILDQFLVESSLVETTWLKGDLAYVTSSRTGFPQGAGLRIIDVSDPENLMLVGEALGQRGYDITVNGDYAYVGGGVAGLRVYDVEEPSEPSLLTTLPPPQGGSILHPVVNGTTAYLSAGNAGFATVNIANPETPTLLDALSLGGFAANVAYANDVAYVPVNGLGLVTIDVSDPSNVVQLGTYNIASSQVRGIALNGTTAYVTGDYGLVILDVSNPSDIREVGSLDFSDSGAGQNIVLRGKEAFVASRYDGVRIIDVSDSSRPRKVSRIPNGGFSLRVFIQGNYAYISDIHGEYRIIDISDPENAEIVGRVETISNTQRSIVRDGIAYVLDADGATTGLSRFDVSIPENPQPIDTFGTGNEAQGIDLDGDVAYIANDQYQFISVDISEPGNFSILDVFNPGNTAYDVRVRDDVAYVAAAFEGLVTVDVSDPSDMVQLNTNGVGYNALALTLLDDLAYLADGTEGLTIVDITDPTEPQELATAPIGNIARGVAAAGGYAYIADEYIGLRQYDVTDPENPVTVASTLSNSRLIDVDARDSLVVAVDAGGGVFLYRAHPQTIANDSNLRAGALRLGEVYPNPFHTGTTIRYFLPERNTVTLEVYDMLGRRVQRLVETSLPNGWHETQLSAEGLSSGLYVIRLTAGKETLIRKVVAM